MPIQTFESKLPATPDDLYAWHTRPGAFARLRPPWQRLEIVRPGPVENGSRVELRVKKGPLWLGWTAEHRDVDPVRGFTDVQVRGPFARWIHRHEFAPDESGCLLRDRIDYRLPGGRLGQLIGASGVAADLEATFGFRHERTRRDLARHADFAGSPRQRIAVSGAGGLIGSNLLSFLTTGGHSVVRLERRAEAASGSAAWSVEHGLLSPEKLGSIDAVVHLAGESIAARRWSPAQKSLIRSSRVDGTRNLVRSLGRLDEPPATFVCASAIGFYGARGAELLDEASSGGTGFLADTCREWEAAALEAAELGMRVVLLRFGIVLSPEGGALAQMLPPFRLGFGGRLGNGSQYMSWISIDDAIGAVHKALLDDRLAGPVNVVAPAACTNRELAAALARSLARPAVFALPEPVVRTAWGEMADEMLLASTRVQPGELLEAGFRFFDTDLDQTLSSLLGRPGTP